MYDDNYNTCSDTYVTLRVYTDNMHPEKITEYLTIPPTQIQVKGDKNELRRNKLIELNGWFLSTENTIQSKDIRRHLDFLADTLLPVKSKLKSLQNDGVKIDISCYWQSESGQGGPTLSPQQLTKLADLGVEVWFDLY